MIDSVLLKVIYYVQISEFRTCLKDHSRNLYAPLCGIFCRKPFSNTL